MKAIFSLATILVILVLSSPLIQAQQCAFDIDTDYYGSDLYYTFVTSRDLCCTLCTAYPGCASFTYVTSTLACWLKSSVSPIKMASPGRKNSIKFYSKTIKSILYILKGFPD